MGLTGWIDVAQRTRLSGWAAWTNTPNTPVELDICVAATAQEPAERIGRVLANGYRAHLDVDNTGYQGRSGFDVDLRDYTLPDGSFLLDIVDSEQGERLPGGPVFVPAASFAPVAAPVVLVEVDGRPFCRLPDDVVLVRVVRNGTLRLTVEPQISAVLLCSPHRTAPGDARLLGARLTRFRLAGSELDVGGEGFLFGFHATEAGWRWTDGVALVVLGPREAAVTVEIDVQDVAAAPALSGGWRISAGLRAIAPPYQRLAYAGRQFLSRPTSPDKKRPAVRS